MKYGFPNTRMNSDYEKKDLLQINLDSLILVFIGLLIFLHELCSKVFPRGFHAATTVTDGYPKKVLNVVFVGALLNHEVPFTLS